MTRKIFYYNYSANKPHEMYQELFRNPPEGYDYITTDAQESKRLTIEKLANLKKIKVLKWIYDKVIKKILSPHFVIQSMSKFREVPNNTDIVHSAGCLYFGKKPWIVDMESVNTLTGHNQFILKRYKKTIEKAFSSPQCKKIITFTNFAKKTIMENLDFSGFKDKIEVIHYATDVYSKKHQKKDKKIRLLFVGSANKNTDINFYIKGGREMVEAFKILNEKHKNLELVIVGCVPQEIKNITDKLKNVKIHPLLTREQLSDTFYESDIFFYPSYIGPGLASIEALGTGLVTISLDIPEYDEFVENGKNGYLIKPSYYEFTENKFLSINDFMNFANRMKKNNGSKLIGEIVDKTSFLIKNPKIMKVMKKEAVIKYQKEFSFKSKRDKLKKIFDEIISENI